MLNKKTIILSMILVSLLAVSAVSAADNSTDIISEDSSEISDNIDLTVSNEDKDILKADEQTFRELNKTINNNTENDIYLNYDYKYCEEDSDFANGIIINRDVNIHGNGHILNGSNQARIFKIESANVTFYNITFTNGNVKNDGGGAIIGTSKAINCTFNENHAQYGGAINWGSAQDCTFTSNTARASGGAMISGSAVNCTFTNNSAPDGGALYLSSAVNCTFTNNTARISGGAISCASPYFEGYARDCIFINNKALTGGAINYGSAVNCTFIENTVTDDEKGKGGAIYQGSAVNCTFTNNKWEDTLESYYANSPGFHYKGSKLTLHFDVDDFNPVYHSKEVLPIHLSNQINHRVGLVDVDVAVYKENHKISSFSCLSEDKLNFDLAAGTYIVELKVADSTLNFTAKNITMTIRKASANIAVSANKVAYPDDVVISVKSDLNGTYNVSIGDKSTNITLHANEGKNVTFKGLAANENAYRISVTYLGPDSENYTGANNRAKVVIEKGTPKIEVSADNVTYPDITVVSVKSDANGSYTVKVGDIAQNVTLVAGEEKNITFKGLAANETGHIVNVTHNSQNYTGFNDTARAIVKKETSKMTSTPLTTEYNVHKYLVIGLKDKQDQPICNVDAAITINGVTYKCRSDNEGNARLIIRLNPKTYTATITFDNANYTNLTQYVEVTVLKATTKITAKKKTYKKTKKVKKYTATLNANGKPLAKVKLTLKIKGKTYKATTNAKGKATFKIKLTKKGKYKATLKFKGNHYYNKTSKTVKITIK